ncbi:MAG: metal-sensitive transcriptional regulator [Bdellovibrionaceae bacterium]|nr:metal-sensitive transcriptional regulator [Bdellovibrionales bacterium]MCB9086567.1 metal-sensitive transcriptional regulator [Pseudobdellovibrionaceae bacterium]
MSEKQGASHTAHLHRLKRLEGQIRGIARMIEERRYCMDILTQLKAVKSALGALEEKIIEQHLNHCVKRALASDDKKDQDGAVGEIMELLSSARGK